MGELDLPKGLGDAAEASAWRERIDQAYERVVFLDRQCRYFEWEQWLAQAPEAKGLSSMKLTVVGRGREWALDMVYEDGRRYHLSPAREDEHQDQYRALGRNEQGSVIWERDERAERVLKAACVALWALDDECWERLEGLVMGPDPQQWRGALFDEAERARWDAALIEESCAAPSARGSKPRI